MSDNTTGTVKVVCESDRISETAITVNGTSVEVSDRGDLLVHGDENEVAVFAHGHWVYAHVTKTKGDS